MYVKNDGIFIFEENQRIANISKRPKNMVYLTNVFYILTRFSAEYTNIC